MKRQTMEIRSVLVFTCLLCLCSWAQVDEAKDEPMLSGEIEYSNGFSYIEFKTLLDSGKIKTVELISMDTGCFGGTGGVAGLYIDAEGKECKYEILAGAEPSSDPFLLAAIRAKNIPVSIKKQSIENMCSMQPQPWYTTILDEIIYYDFGAFFFGAVTIILLSIIVYQVMRTKRAIRKIGKQFANCSD